MASNRLVSLLFLTTMLVTGPAEARFGRRSGSSSSSTSSSSSSSTVHRAAPVGSAPSAASRSTSRGSSGWTFGFGPSYRASRYGYWSGAFVPFSGYGYGAFSPGPGPGLSPQDPVVQPEPSSLRVVAGVEGLYNLSSSNGPGYVLGVAALFEGDRFGVSIAAQTIQTEFNQLSQVNAHLTFAFLTGQYGRLRVEAGVDSFFANDLTVLAPTAGLSGQLWVAGPFALEGAVMATPWPIWQLDYRAGVVLGIDAFGLRAGWRTQIIEDRGLVPGVPEDTTGCAELPNGNFSCRDVLMGPYVGVGMVF